MRDNFALLKLIHKIISEILFNYRIGGVSTTTKANKVKYELLEYIYFKHEEIYKQYFNDFISSLLITQLICHLAFEQPRDLAQLFGKVAIIAL